MLDIKSFVPSPRPVTISHLNIIELDPQELAVVMNALTLVVLAVLLSVDVQAAFVGKAHSRCKECVLTPGATTTSCFRLAANDNDVHDHETETGSSMSRREALQWSGIMLSSWLVPSAIPPSQASATTDNQKNIVLTGGNSGIGYEAALRLAQEGHHVILPCRTYTKSVDAVERLRTQLSSDGVMISAAECDLASIASIKSFAAEALPTILDKQRLDVVCLNAGIARNTNAKDVLRTAEGFELTVGTNHLGHFYLNHMLLPMVEPARGRIVVTASGVHDPESPGGAQGVPATLGDLQGLERDGSRFEMVDGGEFNADKAYKDSKLCNVLFTRELQRRLESTAATRGISANCFNPGLIVGTGLFRDQNQLFTKVFDVAATDLLKVGETPDWGGGALAYMTTINSRGLYYSSAPGSSKYGEDAFGSQFASSATSKEAQDANKAKRLWELSEGLLGIS